MVEAVMLWNEPNNISHWNFEIDPGWKIFSQMVKAAGKAIRAENSTLPRVLGGMSPIDPSFVRTLSGQSVFDDVDILALHGFPLDWNHWTINEWPAKLEEIRGVTKLPLWVSEVGASTFGADEVQTFGLRRTAELLIGKVERIHWYSLFDLPRTWPATTRHREAEGSSYYRHFYMGLVREDGSFKPAFHDFKQFTPQLGICQWFHYQDPRLNRGIELMKDLGVRRLRTGLSWADSFRPDAEKWFDHQMKMLEEFDVTVTYCYTPEHCGILPHHTSPPADVFQFADFCSRMTKRYAS